MLKMHTTCMPLVCRASLWKEACDLTASRKVTAVHRLAAHQRKDANCKSILSWSPLETMARD